MPSLNAAGASSTVSKLRKGTFSCWECKNRKRRCDISRRSDKPCTWCRLRGLQCVGQDQSDPYWNGQSYVQRRLDRLESLLLSHRRQSPADGQRSIRVAQASISCHLPLLCPSPDDLLPPVEARKAHCRQLGDYVLSTLPSPGTMEAITVRGQTTFRQHLGIRDGWSESMNDMIHHPHYLLLATRKLYQLALCLRQIQATEPERAELGLRESLHEAADRFVQAANHVTSQDYLVQSIQGLEVLSMQAYCRIYVGDAASMRPIFQRALTYGQLLEIDQATDADKEEMWFRLVYAERFLSLGLGEKPFAIDDGFASDRLLATSKITRRLERIHVLISGRVISRNMLLGQDRCTTVGREDESGYRITQDIDRQLKQAAKCMPACWWVIPNQDNPSGEDFTHVLTGLHHYYLLVLTHQPYLVGNLELLGNASVDYNKHCAATASREILTRFAFFKNMSYVPCSFVGMAQKATAAIITLLLLHIRGNELGCLENVFEHQRPQDLCLIESNLPMVEEIFGFAEAYTGYGHVSDLRKMLEIEAESAYGTPYSTWLEHSISTSETELNIDTNENVLRIPVPYHGAICVARSDSKKILH